jgi:hypothetical protein
VVNRASREISCRPRPFWVVIAMDEERALVGLSAFWF